MNITLIAAMNRDWVIASEGKIPWHIPEDLRLFKSLTINKHVLMGRKTYESIGKPLVNRYNIVLSRDKRFKAKGVDIIRDISELYNYYDGEELIVIGGGEVYGLMMPYANKMLISYVNQGVAGTTFFPYFCTKEEDKEKGWTTISHAKYQEFEVRGFIRSARKILY